MPITLQSLLIPIEIDKKKSSEQIGSLKDELIGIGQAVVPALGLATAVTAVGNAMADSVKKQLVYANAVRDVSLASGQTAEQSSRLIQVMSDFGITSDDLLKTTKRLSDNGLAPTMKTIAGLAGQYSKLTTVQERNKLIIDNLGKDTAKWHQILSMGEDKLLAMNDAVDESLVLSAKQVQQAREAEIAWDNWNDKIDAVETQFAVGVIPTMTRLLEISLAYSDAHQNQIALWEKIIYPVGIVHSMYLALTDTEQRATNSAMAHSDALDNLTNEAQQTKEELALLEEQIQAESEANREFLSTVETLTGRIQDWRQKQSDIDKQYQEGKITLQEYQEQSKSLADQRELDSKKMILAMLKERLTFDGLTDAEMNGLLKLGLQWGVYTQEAVAEAYEAIAQVNYLADAINGLPSNKHIEITLGGYAQGTPGYEHIAHPGRASGGPVIKGQTYNVAEFYRPEQFTPYESGYVGAMNRSDEPVQAILDADELVRAMVSAYQQGKLS